MHCFRDALLFGRAIGAASPVKGGTQINTVYLNEVKRRIGKKKNKKERERNALPGAVHLFPPNLQMTPKQS